MTSHDEAAGVTNDFDQYFVTWTIPKSVTEAADHNLAHFKELYLI